MLKGSKSNPLQNHNFYYFRNYIAFHNSIFLLFFGENHFQLLFLILYQS